MEPSSANDPRPTLSCVVPCYNENESLHTLHERLTKVCRENVGESYEIVLVNDGSTDNTWEMIEQLSREDSHILGVNLSRNHGHQLALSAGLYFLRGDLIFILDADLQDPPELLGEMMRLADEGADVVYGRRRTRSGESYFKLSTAASFYRILNSISDTAIPKDTGDFRLMKRCVLDVLKGMPECHRFIRGMVSWAGFNQVALEYDRQERHAGTSKYPVAKMVRFAFDAITSFSIFPLKMAFFIGMGTSLVGMALGVYAVVSFFVRETVPGWMSTMLVIVFFGSMQMILIGIVGEYLGRLFIQSKQRPLFVIRDLCRDGVSQSKPIVARHTAIEENIACDETLVSMRAGPSQKAA